MPTDGVPPDKVRRTQVSRKGAENTSSPTELEKLDSGNWPSQLLDMLVECVLPIRGVRITLRTNKDVHLRFQHSHALSAWIRTLAKDASGNSDDTSGFDQLRIDPVETGHVQYATGDLYQLSIFCTHSGLPTLARVLERLWFGQKPPAQTRTYSDMDKLAFSSHWQVHSVEDWFSNEPVSNCDELSIYDAEALQTEATLWQQAATKLLIRQWLSPASLLKTKDKRGK